MDLASKHRDFNKFIHYDSDLVCDDSYEMKVAHDGWYYIGLHNISIEFPDGYNPDQYGGYIMISDLEIAQSGSILISGDEDRKRHGVLIPLNKPGSTHPQCKVYTKVNLHSHDFINIKYAEKDGTIKDVDRIVVTLHIVSNLRYMYVD